MTAPRESYPLCWPDGRLRTPFSKRKEGRFRLTLGAARDDLLLELDRLKARRIIISSDLKARNDGLPFANQGQPRDPGVAVYFNSENVDYVFACDTWDKVEDNVRAILYEAASIKEARKWAKSAHGVGPRSVWRQYDDVSKPCCVRCDSRPCCCKRDEP